MTKKEFIAELFKKGNESGIEEMEVFLQRNSDLSLMVFNKQIDRFTKADEEGLSFRGIYKGKMGYSYTEKLDETSIDILIDGVKSNAMIIDSEDEEVIFEGSKEYNEIDVYDESLEKTSIDRKIQFVKAMEEKALEADERVRAVNYCMFGEQTNTTLMVNTKGLSLEDKSNVAYAYISVMVKDGEDVKTAGEYIVSNDFSKFNPKVLAKKAVGEAVSLLGAKSIKSANYPIVLRNNVAASILEAFAMIFSAERVQKDLSLLKGKIDKKIACDMLTIVDDPFMENGVYSRSFDGEGVATKYKKVIDKGTLKTYLHNSKTAKKDGVESTGNASKASYKASISIAPTNMYIEKGEVDFDGVINSVSDGLLIIDVQGLHSGLDPVSGDFSLSAFGYEIMDGVIGRPVNQITIAGNFFEMLNNIECIGNDLKFNLPGYGYIGSPSLKIRSLAVSGE